MADKIRSLETEVQRLTGQLNKSREDIGGHVATAEYHLRAHKELTGAARRLFSVDAGPDTVFAWEALRCLVSE